MLYSVHLKFSFPFSDFNIKKQIVPPVNFVSMQKHFNLILQICIFCFKKDYLIRQRIDGEIGQLRDNVHRILSEQQEEFAQAFGLHDHDNHSSSEVCHTHPAIRCQGAKTSEVVNSDPNRTIAFLFIMASAIR